MSHSGWVRLQVQQGVFQTRNGEWLTHDEAEHRVSQLENYLQGLKADLAHNPRAKNDGKVVDLPTVWEVEDTRHATACRVTTMKPLSFTTLTKSRQRSKLLG